MLRSRQRTGVIRTWRTKTFVSSSRLLKDINATCASTTGRTAGVIAVVADEIRPVANNCRGGPPWPPVPVRNFIAKTGGHGGPPLQLFIPLLQDVECFLLLAAVRDQSLAVPVVLDVWQRAAWRPEVRQDPWRGPTQERNLLQHRDLMLVDTFLILLGPSRACIAMMTIQSIAAKLTHH